MSIKKRYWIPGLILVWLIIVIAKAPASWTMALMSQAIPGWQATQVQGSFWQGSAGAAQLSLTLEGYTQALPLGKFKWKILPLSLFTLNPCVRFSAVYQEQAIDGEACVAITDQTISSDQLKVRMDIDTLSPWLIVQLSGQTTLDISKVAISNNQVTNLQGQLQWNDAQIFVENRWIKLGDLQARMDDDQNGGIITQWNSVNPEPLATDLKIQLPSTGGTLFQGTVTPGRTIDPGVEQFLRYQAESLGNGRYQIDYQL